MPRPDFPCAAKEFTTVRRRRFGTRTAQIRRLRPGGLVGDLIDTRRRLIPSEEILANDLGQH